MKLFLGMFMFIHNINIKEVEEHLGELIKRVQNGDEVVISQKGHPTIKLVICEPTSKGRKAGLHMGAIQMSDDFNDLLEDSYCSGQI